MPAPPALIDHERNYSSGYENTTKISAYRSIINSMRAPSGSDPNASLSRSDQGKVLLTCLESGRDLLARWLVREHHTVTDPDLNYIPVSSILQILFLKTGQECGFVEPGTLFVLAECDGIAQRMARACSDAGLSPDQFFERGPEGTRIFPGLPDELLRDIIHRMDQPDIPVPLSGLPLEELVAVLEQFLGTRMQAAEGYRVNRIGKSSLLYTGSVDVPPQMVVEYMVSEAIGGITDISAAGGRTVSRIVDPACGSGFFLLAAYRYLVRKKTKFHDRSEQVKNLLQDLAGRSIFGTDIDPDSVSAARIVLLFAFIEESKRSGSGVELSGQIRGVCTFLIKNIRCGNALIAPDYFSGKPVFPFNADERRKVNPFDWREAFPHIMDEGGFDAVIGAPPPYRPFSIPAREEYFQTHYDTYASSAGLYGYFIERGLSLLKPSGIISVLVPGTFLRSQSARSLRRILLSRQIVTIINTGRTRLLPEGETLMYALSLRNKPPDRPFVVSPGWNSIGPRQECISCAHDFMLDQRTFDDGGWKLDDTRIADILEKIQRTGTPLEQYVMGEIDFGTHRVRNNPLVVDTATKNLLTKKAWWCRHFFVPLLRPVDIRRYVPERPERYLLLIGDNRNLRKGRALVAYLEKAMSKQGREPGIDDSNAHSDSASGVFMSTWESEESRPKIIFSPYQFNPAFCYDPAGTYAITHTLLAIPRNDPFLVGILNSLLGRFVIIHTCSLTDRGYHISSAALGKFPVFVPDFEKLPDKTRHDKMVALVSQILGLNRYLTRAKTDQERRLVQQEIDATDVRIDALVYELYGLTLEEIAVVEESVEK
jgi:adenine-specific DNA-methyltransferase